MKLTLSLGLALLSFSAWSNVVCIAEIYDASNNKILIREKISTPYAALKTRFLINDIGEHYLIQIQSMQTGAVTQDLLQKNITLQQKKITLKTAEHISILNCTNWNTL